MRDCTKYKQNIYELKLLKDMMTDSLQTSSSLIYPSESCQLTDSKYNYCIVIVIIVMATYIVNYRNDIHI